jgi:hypothetical protein
MNFLTLRPQDGDPTKFVVGRRPRDGLHIVNFGQLKPTTSGNPEAPLPERLVLHAEPNPAQIRAAPYYPDPASAYLVLRLRHHSNGQWLEPAAVVPIRDAPGEPAAWPDVMPVHVSVVTTPPDGDNPQTSLGSRIKKNGIRWLDQGGLIAESESKQKLRVQSITVGLVAGEQAYLDSWFVPSLEDLAAWFDVVEATLKLAAVEGAAAGERQNVCRGGLVRLLGADVVAVGEAAVCKAVSAEDGERVQLASLLHEASLRESLYPASLL